jgi:hypothetical protein
LLEKRISWLEARSIQHHFLVAPNAHSVYPEDLPPGFGSGERRPILQLMDYLEAEKSHVQIIYPIEELRSQKHRNIYPKTETHWSEFGAFIAYKHLMREVSAGCDVPVLSETELEIWEEKSVGDLGAKLDPPQSSMHLSAEVRHPRATVVSDNLVFNQGRRVEYQAVGSSNTSCLVYGDSFSYRLIPFLAESFERLLFVHLPTLDYALFEHEKPDVAICVMTERFLISAPNDQRGRTLNELASEKQAAGRLWPRVNLRGNRVPG